MMMMMMGDARIIDTAGEDEQCRKVQSRDLGVYIMVCLWTIGNERERGGCYFFQGDFVDGG